MEIRKTYSELLRDPRWQRKRLEVFQRDKFCCLMCGSNEDTLHVHHLKYCKNPWDVSNDELQTLCFLCHEVAELAKKEKVKYTNVNRLKSKKGDFYVYALSHRPESVQLLTLFHNGFGKFIRLEIDLSKESLITLLNTI